MKNFGYYTNMWNSIREQTVCDVIYWLTDQTPNGNRPVPYDHGRFSIRAYPRVRMMAAVPQGVKDIEQLVNVFVRLEQQKMTRVKEANQLINQIRASAKSM